MNLQDQTKLAAALLDPAVYGPTVDEVEKLETHISYVLLAGPHVYKIKKAVDLGFLDFRTLSARHFYCQEELRLNRRLAPTLYLGVIPIAGSIEHPVLGGDGPAIEYAVKMRRFPQDQMLNRLLADGRLTPAHIDELAAKTAAFHAAVAVASSHDAYGTPEAVAQPALENFTQIEASEDALLERADLDFLRNWTEQQCRSLHAVFAARKAADFVRECHGDFHLRNIALVDGAVTPFDCIEFSENLRWIDVMNEVAFLVMDLHDKQRPDLARRFLNGYLEITGDYEGLRVLRFYVVYRALVRAKIHWLRAHQQGVTANQRSALLAQYRAHIALAKEQTQAASPAVLITHGVSGSGKTTATQPLLELIGAVRVRSDIERKRLHRLKPQARTGSRIGQDAYSADATALTYRRLLGLARSIVEAGYTVIVDATFLAHAQRGDFRRLAEALGARFLILDFGADEATLRARIVEREKQHADASEADIAVLEHQLRTEEPLQPEEQSVSVRYEFKGQVSDAEPRKLWAAAVERLGWVRT